MENTVYHVLDIYIIDIGFLGYVVYKKKYLLYTYIIIRGIIKLKHC